MVKRSGFSIKELKIGQTIIGYDRLCLRKDVQGEIAEIDEWAKAVWIDTPEGLIWIKVSDISAMILEIGE
jgi:hypothetical protein